MKDVLEAALQYRDAKASLYRAAETAAAEPEYVPWTGSPRPSVSSCWGLTWWSWNLSRLTLSFWVPAASGGVGGVRTVVSRQHEIILRSVYPHADSELRGALCEQLVALLDIYLSGYVAQLTSVQQRRERYSSLEMEYSQRRAELLAPLRECLRLLRLLFLGPRR